MSDFPDTFGLPEYYATAVVTEADGPNVRVVYGVARGGQMQWLFSCVIRADQALTIANNTRAAAELALCREQHDAPTNATARSLN